MRALINYITLKVSLLHHPSSHHHHDIPKLTYIHYIKATLFEPVGATEGASDEDMFSAETTPTALTPDIFAERLASMPFVAPLGPTATVDASEPPSKETAVWLW